MTNRIKNFVAQISQQRTLRRWRRLAGKARGMDITELRSARARARALKLPVTELIHIADSRLMLPMVGADAMQSPANSDWTYRPEIWRQPVTPRGMAALPTKLKLGNEAKVFHDCKTSELIIRQLRNARPEDLAPFGLQLEVFSFDGSFLSVALDLPNEAALGMRKKHLLRMDVIVEAEKPLKIFARLNIKHGPNTEQVVRELPLDQGEVMVEFDLAYANLNEKRVCHMWVDLIFDDPQMNQVTLRDVTFSRQPRAEL